MTYYIMVENGKQGNYKAQVLGWPETSVQGSSRQEVLARIREQINLRLQQVEIIPVDIEPTTSSQHPWMKFAGMFENDPMFDQVLKNIEEYRHELDADEKAS